MTHKFQGVSTPYPRKCPSDYSWMAHDTGECDCGGKKQRRPSEENFHFRKPSTPLRRDAELVEMLLDNVSQEEMPEDE